MSTISKILAALAGGPMTSPQLQKNCHQSKQAIDAALRKLRAGGAVDIIDEGRLEHDRFHPRLYELTCDGPEPAVAGLNWPIPPTDIHPIIGWGIQ